MYAFCSLAFGLVGMLMRYKLASWAACFCACRMLANLRSAEVDMKQVFSAIGFSVMGLVLNYLAPTPPVAGS